MYIYIYIYTLFLIFKGGIYNTIFHLISRNKHTWIRLVIIEGIDPHSIVNQDIIIIIILKRSIDL